MIIKLSDPFERAYREMPKLIQKKIDKTLLLLESNPRHPSLHVEKIDFSRNIWSARVNRNYRITFHWISGGILLRKVGSHQEAYRKP